MQATTLPQEPRAWLPEAAIRAVDIDGALSGAARDWSTKWFASRVVLPLDTLTVNASPAAMDGERLMLDHDLAITVATRAKTILPGSMLDFDIPDNSLTAADERLLSEITQACLDDLCRRIAEVFRLDASARWDRAPEDAELSMGIPMVCTLGIESHTPLVRIWVAHDALVGLAKASLPPLLKQKRLSGIANALADQNIVVSAHVGRCSLTLADVSGLGVGDVLVFDRAVDAPVEMTLNAADAPLARCTIGQTDDRFDLTLLESIGG